MNGSVEKPKFVIAHAYVKDVSFENPYFLDLMNQSKEGKPDIRFNFEIKINQGDEQHFEVVLIVKLDLLINDKSYIKTEVVYGALAQVEDGPHKEEALFVDIPHQIYPEVRPVITHLFAQASALPAFKIPIVDFRALYQKRLAEREEEQKKQNKPS